MNSRYRKAAFMASRDPVVVSTMVTSSVKPVGDIFAFPPSLIPTEASLSAYRRVFELQPFAQQYFNSGYIAAVVTVGTLAVSSLAGYAFARIRFRGQQVLFVVVLVGLTLRVAVVAPPGLQR